MLYGSLYNVIPISQLSTYKNDYNLLGIVDISKGLIVKNQMPTGN